MSNLFVCLKGDEQAILVLKILEEMHQKTLVIEAEPEIETASLGNELLIGIFTSPDTKLIVRGHLSRIASHRLLLHAPEWSKKCHLFVALRESFDEKARLKEMCREWIRVFSGLSTNTLGIAAPWGSLPTSPTNFSLYREWISKSLRLSPDDLGINFISPIKNLSLAEVKIIRNRLKNKKNKRLTDHIIRTAQKTANPVSIEDLIFIGSKLIDLTEEGRLKIDSSSQFEMVLNCLFQALSGNILRIMAPLCPAWTHNETGYTFCGLENDSCGRNYQKMKSELDYFIKFLEELGVNYELIIWVADIEWFNIMEDPSASEAGMVKKDFMETIARQCELVESDVKKYCKDVKVEPFLRIFAEEEYLRTVASEKEKFIKTFTTSASTRKYFENTLKIKLGSYQRHYDLSQTSKEPHPRAKNALVRDMLAHLAPLVLFQKANADSNFMFLLQNEPFTQLYKDVPWISWHNKETLV